MGFRCCLIELDDVALQVGQAVIDIGLAACLVAQGEGVALLVIDEVDAVLHTVFCPELVCHPAVEIQELIGNAVDSFAGADVIHAVGERQGVIAAGGLGELAAVGPAEVPLSAVEVLNRVPDDISIGAGLIGNILGSVAYGYLSEQIFPAGVVLVIGKGLEHRIARGDALDITGCVIRVSFGDAAGGLLGHLVLVVVGIAAGLGAAAIVRTVLQSYKKPGEMPGFLCEKILDSKKMISKMGGVVKVAAGIKNAPQRENCGAR